MGLGAGAAVAQVLATSLKSSAAPTAPAATVADTKFCVACGKLISARANFCAECGKPQ